MIRCTPRGLCSWNFDLKCMEHSATLEFNWLGEQGRLTIDGRLFDVKKHGVLSGHWTLRYGAKNMMSAQKSSAFTRTFDIVDATTTYVLRATSPFGRSFQLQHDGATVATIAPEHPFTRRATMRMHKASPPFQTLCFAFWLVALTWRRAAQNGAAGGGA